MKEFKKIIVFKTQVFENIRTEEAKMAKQTKIEDIMMPIFDGVNYSSWRIRLMTLLEYKECNEPAVSKITEAYRNRETDWKKMDLKAKTIIMSSISDRQLEYVTECTTALQMITKFDTMYKIKSTALQIICRGKIEETKLTNYNTVEEFFVEFEKSTNDFKAAGGKLDETEKVRYLLRALPISYSYIGDFIDVIPEDQRTVDYVKSKIKEKNMTKAESQNKSNVSTFASQTKGKCFNCGKAGHYKNECTRPQHNRAAVAEVLILRKINEVTTKATAEEESTEARGEDEIQALREENLLLINKTTPSRGQHRCAIRGQIR